ncbi:MAG: guanylate kinase [Clostridiales bacterium]|jgi:guanylate kinase|nr:guanylate kinase [Clostridiales bacterium]MDY2971611.1 guanylate kinase [Eubacteriales bacterium]MCI6946874.1 guanylate kinase [Clostridiales bacterium]MCI6976563.1 guanylate kinase [Clostridiales bacterium]MDD7054955.1 guanylate kinase [Clostridiales bacterium]
MKKGTFFVLSGPSGSGKGTVLKEVLRKSDRIVYSVSATSRSPRAGEVDGINYYFKSREEFETLIKADAFIEYTETYGNYYGTLKSEVEKAIVNGKNIILEIDPVGARNVRAHYPDAVLMFLVAPDLEVLSSRLSGRGSESAETFKIRHDAALSEMENATLYDYVVVNDFVERAADDILAIIRAENLRTKNSIEILSRIKGGNKL